MDTFELLHLQHGRPAFRRPDGEADLADDPALWGQLWRKLRVEALAAWIELYPGTRPPAWWEFDAPRLPAQGEDESEPAFLDRTRQIRKAELAAIQAKARELAWYDETRHPDDPGSNFIPPDELHEFARDRGLLTPREVAVLWPPPPARWDGRIGPRTRPERAAGVCIGSGGGRVYGAHKGF